MAVLDLFGPRRGNLGRIYEVLKVSEEPLPRTRIWQAANYNPQRGLNYLFMWLWEQGFIEKIEYEDAGKVFRALKRRPPANSKGLFRITEKGRGAVYAFEALFDIMGVSDKVRMRFPKDAGGVKTHLASGLKVRT